MTVKSPTDGDKNSSNTIILNYTCIIYSKQKMKTTYHKLSDRQINIYLMEFTTKL